MWVKCHTLKCEMSDFYCYIVIKINKTNVYFGAVKPDIPNFTWYRQPTENGLATIKVVWDIKTDEKPGSHFFVKYRIKGKTFMKTI